MHTWALLKSESWSEIAFSLQILKYNTSSILGNENDNEDKLFTIMKCYEGMQEVEGEDWFMSYIDVSSKSQAPPTSS